MVMQIKKLKVIYFSKGKKKITIITPKYLEVSESLHLGADVSN